MIEENKNGDLFLTIPDDMLLDEHDVTPEELEQLKLLLNIDFDDEENEQ